MTTLISYIITMVLVLNGHGWWAVAFFIIGTLAAISGGENDN